MNTAQPDITLRLDVEGVIRGASSSAVLSDEHVEAWVGCAWAETVADVGSDKVRRMLEDARDHGVSAFRQVNQRFPSGLELPVEYTAVKVGDAGGLVAIGKNLQSVAELQSRLIAAQQAMERDYWKLREVETRYRLLFDASNEAVLLLNAGDLQVVEANPAAIRALGLNPVGRDFLRELAERDREPFQTMLLRVRAQGKAPGILAHLGPNHEPWLVRVSLMSAEPGAAFLLQVSSVVAARPGRDHDDVPTMDALLRRSPDGFVVVDRNGEIVRANRAFLNLVEMGTEASVVGERLGRWLSRPGADLNVLLATVRRYGVVRLFATGVQGELGSDTEVEISAAGDRDDDPHYLGVLLRAVGQRPSGRIGDQGLGGLIDGGGQIGKSSLRQLVRDAVTEIERHYIQATLDLTGGNRTAAAEILGLSRQSLYAKLNRYDLEGTVPASGDRRL